VLVILATYNAAAYTTIAPELLTNIAAGLFILPYVLFSGIAGQLAVATIRRAYESRQRKRDCHHAVASIGFLHAQHLDPARASVSDGRAFHFLRSGQVRLLPQGIGTIEKSSAATAWSRWGLSGDSPRHACCRSARQDRPTRFVITAILGVAAIGFVASLAIPKLPPDGCDAASRLNLGPRAGQTSRLRAHRVVPSCRFWHLVVLFYCALVLAQLPTYSKNVINGTRMS